MPLGTYIYTHMYIRIFEHSFLHLPGYVTSHGWFDCIVRSSSIASQRFFRFLFFFYSYYISKHSQRLSIDAYRIHISCALSCIPPFSLEDHESPSRGSRGSWIFAVAAAPPPPPPAPRWLTFKVKRHELFHAHVSPPIIRHSRFWYGFSFLPIKKHPPVD